MVVFIITSLNGVLWPGHFWQWLHRSFSTHQQLPCFGWKHAVVSVQPQMRHVGFVGFGGFMVLVVAGFVAGILI